MYESTTMKHEPQTVQHREAGMTSYSFLRTQQRHQVLMEERVLKEQLNRANRTTQTLQNRWPDKERHRIKDLNTIQRNQVM